MNKFNLLLAFLVAATFSSCVTTQQSGTSMLEKNSIGKWKPTDFAGHGDVTVKNGVLKLGMGIELTGVNWTGELPKGEYEISFEGRRVQGNDFFCGLTFPVKGSHATLILGGWGGALVGISSLDNLMQLKTKRVMSMYLRMVNGMALRSGSRRIAFAFGSMKRSRSMSILLTGRWACVSGRSNSPCHLVLPHG